MMCAGMDELDEESILCLTEGYECLRYAHKRKDDVQRGRAYDLDEEGKRLSKLGSQSVTGQAYVKGMELIIGKDPVSQRGGT
jgi:hypothetical protein